LSFNNILAWWDTGVDDVSVHVNGDEKSDFTVLATVSASQKKWSLFFVAKGKTERAEQSQIGNIANNWHAHSESGWMKGKIYGEYLKNLRNQVAAGECIFLICDVHMLHRTAPVRALATELSIALLYLPPGR
jgi:hypothetical protein